MNESRTCANADTNLTQPGSRPVRRFRLISPNGHAMGRFDTALEAASAAGGFWPGVGQDETRTGKGWDIEVIS